MPHLDNAKADGMVSSGMVDTYGRDNLCNTTVGSSGHCGWPLPGDRPGRTDRPHDRTDRPPAQRGQCRAGDGIHTLGVVGRSLYLTPVFFANKPVERLLRPGLTAEMLNDDSLGRALDRLYEAGLTDIFSQAASHALRLWDIHHRFVHLAPLARWRGEDAKPEKPEVVRITSTSSRAKRPNLKQV